VRCCNGLFAKVLGYDREDVLGQSVQTFFVESYSIGELVTRFHEQIHKHQSYFRIHAEAKNGDVIKADMTILSMQLDGVSMYSIIMSHTRNMRELSLLQQFSGAFIRDVNLGVIIMDRNFNLVEISDMACRILGIQSEDVMNKPMHDIFYGMPLEHQLVQRAIL